MNPTLLYFALFYGNAYHVDPALVLSVAYVETKLEATAVGKKGELGIMQVRPYLYPNIPKHAFFDVGVNIRLGTEMLAKAKTSCKHKKDNTFVVCYNMGVKRASSIKYPTHQHYYKDVMKQLPQMQSYFKGR